MKVSDVMTHRVLSVRPTETVKDAVSLMLRENISGLPVVDADGKLVGVVTEGDFLRRTETDTERRRPSWLQFLVGPGRLAEEYVHTHARRIEEVMTRKVVTATPDTPLDEAVQLMEQYRIKRLPVLDKGKLIGIVSRANLLRALVSLTAGETAPSPTDSSIHDCIIAEIEAQPWGPRTSINAVVRNGIVDLWGAVYDEREREALLVVAENIAGVKEVRDHLVWVEPLSGGMVLPPPNGKGGRLTAE